MANYLAIIHKDPKSEYGVSFPDFPGCVTAGRSIDEAREMAQDALALHIQGMAADGEKIPTPSKLDDILAQPDYSDAAAILVVGVAEPKPHAVRVNVTLPEDTLRKIDRIAKKRGMSRSSFLVHAAEKVIIAESAAVYAPIKQGWRRENRRRASAEKR
jgi:predicted RNase H-like HicB family nuclease/predicted transcriptional regulator